MTLKEKINGILTKYGVKLSVEEAAKVEFMAKGTTADGVEIMSPDAEFAVGSEIFYNDAEGNPVPLADGEYMIADGTVKIAVSGGRISEMETVEIEAEKEKDEAELSSVIEQLAQRLSDVEAKLAEKETALSAVTAERDAAKKEATDAKAEVAKLSKEPAATSVKKAALAADKKQEVDMPKSLANPIAQKIFEGLRKAN
jgi:hypothetical protein